MSLYSEKDADTLIAYYSDLMIGKRLPEYKNGLIATIGKNLWNMENQYHVEVIFDLVQKDFLVLRDSIETVANIMNLKSPFEVLKEANQH